jgi:hypothetical protein
MTTPKHLAREFGITFKYCRKLLRRRYVRRAGRRWMWTEREADRVRRWLKARLSGGAR